MERLHMHHVRDVIYRLRQGDSERRIAADLGLSRPTVHKYRQLAQAHGFLQPEQPLADETALLTVLGVAPRPPRQPSSLVPYQETVLALLEQGLELTALYERLREHHGYTGSYSAVRRFVHRLCPPEPQVVVRVHSAPGEEAQVDFGSVGRLYDPRTGRLRVAYVFVATLSYSRHQYAELVFDQTIPTWIALHRRAFESWGGVPKRIVPDNLKAAVSKALVDEPILGEAYRRLAQHYGFVISPTRPGTPRHKGKVENGVHYVQRNFMAGQDFIDSDVANRRLLVWVQERAGVRLHGTTHQAPLQLFHDHEQACLLPLPTEPFSLREIRLAKVHSDCHVTIAKSYYSVPYTYVGQTLEAHIGERLIELFHHQELVASHLRAHQPGEWHTRTEHYPHGKAAYLEHHPAFCCQAAARLGPATSQVIQSLLAERPLHRLRSAQAILRLEETVGPQRLEAACARAVHFATPSYRRIKEILNAALDREPLPETLLTPPAPASTFARPASDFFPQEVQAC